MTTSEKMNYIGKRYALNRSTIDETHCAIIDLRVVFGRADVLVENANGIRAWRTFTPVNVIQGGAQ